MSRGPSESESWRTEKILERSEEKEIDVGLEAQPWRDDEHMTTSSPTEWLSKWQQDKARWEEERAKWQRHHAHRSGRSSATSPPPPPSGEPPSLTSAPLSGPPPPNAIRAQSSEGDVGRDAGWLSRLWESSRRPSRKTADANSVPQQ
ncbi:hypothetical protein K438DRAFT_1825651 [Mycena galopus ATCC 62051]|nr:hypothetical protein K438DRAFT_1825651 [Mycena galopus ATCC 62051]